AGYRPLVADFFCDDDTRVLAGRVARLPGDLRSGIDGGALVDCLKALAGSEEPAALVYGSGFEGRPELIAEMGRHFPVAGNGAETVRRTKDPQRLARDCAALGIPHPAFSWAAPSDPEHWVVKKVGGAGGSHVRRANGAVSAPGCYFQRFVPGQSVSVLFVGDGRAARVVGFSRQWTAPTPAAPHRYGGAVRLKRFDRNQAQTISGWLCRLTARTGLKGLCSADFIGSGGALHLVEVNPRPGATLDIFDSDEAPLIEAHLAATEGAACRLPRFADCMASMIVYTRGPIDRFPAIAWPEGVADRQSPGTRLQPGEP
ncbi:ATP-grasp domain-containing protein, partial [Nitratireductor sp. GCM10026969]|uniref:ATP-grasp domain-containing protein n=1 Tax=Nitratireductor sp. GCM10026969 TaxID=3252645 RepID=UPI00360816A3